MNTSGAGVICSPSMGQSEKDAVAVQVFQMRHREPTVRADWWERAADTTIDAVTEESRLLRIEGPVSLVIADARAGSTALDAIVRSMNSRGWVVLS